VIFDDFPGTTAQAEAVDDALAARRLQLLAIVLEVTPEIAVERIARRRELSLPTARREDSPQSVSARLAAQTSRLAGVVNHFERAGRLRRIDASRSPADVLRDVVRIVEAH
jgi:adenylate kinase